jgi:hypothetical protein
MVQALVQAAEGTRSKLKMISNRGTRVFPHPGNLPDCVDHWRCRFVVRPEAVAQEGTAPVSLKAVLHEAFTDGAHLLLIGSLVVGAVTGEKGGQAMQPFTGNLFKGFLAFFLLEMGLLVGRRLREVRDVGPFLIGFGLVMPPLHAAIALLLARLAGTSLGDATMLAVLAASASYIVVPAVVRHTIPEARPSHYFTMSLAVTFPFNVRVGIPLYYALASRLWG